MSGLSEALAAPQRQATTGPPCSVQTLLRGLPADERTALNTALGRDSGWRTSDLTRTLAANGHHVSQQQIGRHRRGTCRCGQ